MPGETAFRLPMSASRCGQSSGTIRLAGVHVATSGEDVFSNAVCATTAKTTTVTNTMPILYFMRIFLHLENETSMHAND